MTEIESNEENLVSLTTKREEKTSPSTAVQKKDSSFDFEAVIRANREKEDKLKKEREKANTSVKRSYRLTPKK